MPNLRRVEPADAIAHSLWEAHACIGQWAFCACIAMLRKALDLWSAWYRDQYGMAFNKEAKEKDDVFWRLRKIADANPLYGDTIHTILDGIREEGNDALHDPVVCSGGQSGTWDGMMIESIREPYIHLHSLVVNLIKVTMPQVQPFSSDQARWRRPPPR